MILHVYHCSLAVITDYTSAPGRNRPEGTGRFPERPGEADVAYLPPVDGFDDPSLGRLLRVFRQIDLADLDNAPVRLNWDVLEGTLGLNRAQVRELLTKADEQGLLQRLTIDYDHRQWLRHSREKGCLVVMTCVEETDLKRHISEYVREYCDTIDEIRNGILNEDQTLRHVFVVPNGHLAPRAGAGLPWQDALRVLDELPAGLRQRGYEAQLNSYGYTKIIRLAINAHKLGYVLRVV